MIATDEYTARDALPLIDVEYEPLPAVVNARKALDPDAPLIRDDKDGQVDNLASPTWEAGDEEATDRAFAEADIVVTRDIIYPRCHPAPMETCGMIADFNPQDRAARHLQRQPGAARPPHGVRARGRPGRAHDPDPLQRHRRRLRQQGAGVPGLRVRDRRLDRRRRAGQVDRGPLREPDVDRVRPRLHHARRDVRQGRQDHRPAGRRDRRPRRVRLDRPADQVPGRLLPHLLRLLRPARPRTSRSRPSTPTRRPAASRTGARSGSPRPCTWSSGWSTRWRSRWASTRSTCGCRSFIEPEQFPYETTTGWTYDSGNYAKTMSVAMDIAGYDDLRREQAEKRARGELMGIGVSFFTEGVGAGPRKHMDILGLAMNDGADLRVHPSGKAVVSASAPRPRARATRRRSPRSSPRSSGSRPRTSRSATATPTSRRTGSAPTAAARRRCPARRSRSSRARCATRRA